MTRSPLFYALNRGADGDAGGVADLQTDVMRFMAIISLCLMAIFALVQSIPLAPVVQETGQAKAKPAPQSIDPAYKPAPGAAVTFVTVVPPLQNRDAGFPATPKR